MSPRTARLCVMCGFVVVGLVQAVGHALEDPASRKRQHDYCRAGKLY